MNSKLKEEIDALQKEYDIKKSALDQEYEPKIETLKMKCTHIYDAGTSARKMIYAGEPFCAICDKDL